MSTAQAPVSKVFVDSIVDEACAAVAFEEVHGPDTGPYLLLTHADEPETSAGCVRVWRGGDTNLDRMVHMRLVAGPVETQLLFLFGKSDSCMPHLHVQVVEFPPDGCVYNVDLLPRLDPVDHPDWFTRVFSGLRRPYRKATQDEQNSCAQAPANPALAVYMSPWGIASGRTDVAELERVTPSIREYVRHYLSLAQEADWDAPPGEDMAARDARHMERFLDDALDPRAWNGVYRVIGEARGRMIKQLLKLPLEKN